MLDKSLNEDSQILEHKLGSSLEIEQGNQVKQVNNDQYPCCECPHCKKVLQVLSSVEGHLLQIEGQLSTIKELDETFGNRKFFSVAEFAKLVGKSEYTVREWCRLGRINSEKAETGYGDSKSWKIPASELLRYRDHGLLPVPTRY